MRTIIRYAISLCLAAAMLCGLLVVSFAEETAEEKPHTCMAGDKTIEDVVEPTCMTEGSYNEVIRCKICNNIIVSTPVIVKKTTAHTWDEGVVTKRVTRTEEGELTCSCVVEGCTAKKTVVIPINPFLLGDVDADGVITSGDSRLALRFSVGLDTEGCVVEDPEDDSFKATDYDQNGEVDASDARLILRKAVGLEP